MYIISYLLPLWLIGVCFNALVHDKQSGQLRLMMIQGVSPRRLLLNQIFIRASIIVLPLMLVTSVSLLLFSPTISLQVVASLMGLILGYSCFWLALCVLVISLGKSAAYNASLVSDNLVMFSSGASCIC